MSGMKCKKGGMAWIASAWLIAARPYGMIDHQDNVGNPRSLLTTRGWQCCAANMTFPYRVVTVISASVSGGSMGEPEGWAPPASYLKRRLN